jgi:chromosome segregation ATPase
MQNLKVCPTCLQNVDAVYRANVLNKLYNETFEIKRKIEELEGEKKKVFDNIKINNSKLNSLEKQFTEYKIMKLKFESMKDKELKILDLIKQNNNIEKDISLIKSQTERVRAELLELAKYDNLFEEKSRELAISMREERAADIKLAETKKEIEVFEKSVNELKEKIESIEKIKIK